MPEAWLPQGSEGTSWGLKDGRHWIMRAITRVGLENIPGRGPGGAEDGGRAAAH